MTDLVASLVLKLEDQLSGGLRKLQDQLQSLRGIGAGITLGGLADGEGLLGRVAKAATGLSEQLTGVQRMARGAGEALRIMASGAVDGFNKLREAGGGVVNAGRNFANAGSHAINGAFGAAAEGFAVVEPIKEFAERDKLLRSIGIQEGKSGPALNAEVARLNALVNRDALAHGLSSESVAEAYKDLLGQGLPRAQIDGIIGAHSAAAKAYGISADTLGPLTGALVGNLKIGSNEQEAGGALAAIAYATQQGRFKVGDFSHALPGISGVAASLGITGRGALNEIAAGLEISAKTATDPTQAGVNFQDLLGYITSNREDNLSRKKLGIDLPALLLRAQKAGTNPLDAYLGVIKHLTAGKSPLEQAQVISKLVTNQQARLALLALIQHNDEFEKLRKILGGINDEKLKLDESSAQGGAQTALDRLAENFKQIKLTLGEGFAPVLDFIANGLGRINQALTFANANYPQTTHLVLGIVAGLLAFGAAVTLLGAIWPVFTTGFSLLGAVLRFAVVPLQFLVGLLAGLLGVSAAAAVGIAALAAAFGAAAYGIYRHWGNTGYFFADLWTGIKGTFSGFISWVDGWSGGAGTRSVANIAKGWAGLSSLFALQWEVVKSVFGQFMAWVDGWSGGLASRILAGIRSGWGNLVSGVGALLNGLADKFDNGFVGRLLGLAQKKTGAPSAANDNGVAGATGAAPAGRVDVHLHADPGTAVTNAQASGQGVSVQGKVAAAARGNTLGRP